MDNREIGDGPTEAAVAMPEFGARRISKSMAGSARAANAEDERQRQMAIEQSEHHLRMLVDTLPTMVWAANPTGEPSYLNKRLIDYVGLTLNDLEAPDSSVLQMAIQSSVHPDDAETVGRALVHSFTTGDPFAMKYRQRRADGVYRWTDGRAEPLRGADGGIVQWYGVSLDVDDEMRAEETLRRAQDKLALAAQAASLAELAASIAHEVNQPLAAILASANALERWLAADPPNLERTLTSAMGIVRDANAAAEVIDRIRALFKGATNARLPLDVNAVIEETAKLMDDTLKRRSVALKTQLDPALPRAVADRVQMQQVLTNLIRNGFEAMDVAGHANRVVRVISRRQEDSIRIEVHDHGEGIAEPERAFEPFFSTKANGMGMGLAICRSIIESHDGHLWVASTGPDGTTIAFTLPIVA